MKKYEFVKKNISVVRAMIKSGDLSSKILTEYNIYSTYLATKSEEKKMTRYRVTAELNGCSQRSVMRAIREMESQMKV